MDKIEKALEKQAQAGSPYANERYQDILSDVVRNRPLVVSMSEGKITGVANKPVKSDCKVIRFPGCEDYEASFEPAEETKKALMKLYQTFFKMKK